MAKQVFPRDQVAHLWANASQDSARNATGNFFFTGARIFSYGSHFVAAQRTDWKTKDGRAVFITNGGSYSMTTNRHMGSVHGAIPRYAASYALKGLTEATMRGLCADMPVRVIEAAAKEARPILDKAATRVAPHLRHWDIVRAYELRELADIAAAHAKDKRAARAALRAFPELPSKEATRADMKETRRRVEVSRAIETLAAEFRGYNVALNACLGFLDTGDSATWNIADTAVRAINYKANVLGAAKRAGKRAPKMLANSELAAIVERVRVAVRPRDMKREEESAYSDLWRLRGKLSFDTRESGYALDQIAERAQSIAAKSATYPESETLATIAAWITPSLPFIAERVATLQAMDEATAALDAVESGADIAGIESMARDASRHYVRALGAARSALRRVPDKTTGFAADVEAIAAHAKTCHEKLAATFEAADAARIASWRAGDTANVRDLGHGLPRLRISPRDASQIETSWGAYVPVNVAPALWAMVRHARKANAPSSFGDNGPTVGAFKLREVQADGTLVVGCHEIPGAEIDYMARTLGYVRDGV